MGALKLGIIGCGFMVTRHLATAVALDGVEPFAAADLIPERVEEARRQFGVARTYSSGARLVRDPDVEAVVLAFPTAGRPRLALAAFRAGKHVLTEKPVAMNAGQVRRMIAARGRLVGAVLSCRQRFTPHALAAADFLASGALGTLRLLRMRSVDAAGPQPDRAEPVLERQGIERGHEALHVVAFKVCVPEEQRILVAGADDRFVAGAHHVVVAQAVGHGEEVGGQRAVEGRTLVQEKTPDLFDIGMVRFPTGPAGTYAVAALNSYYFSSAPSDPTAAFTWYKERSFSEAAYKIYGPIGVGPFPSRKSIAPVAVFPFEDTEVYESIRPTMHAYRTSPKETEFSALFTAAYDEMILETRPIEQILAQLAEEAEALNQ